MLFMPFMLGEAAVIELLAVMGEIENEGKLGPLKLHKAARVPGGRGGIIGNGNEGAAHALSAGA